MLASRWRCQCSLDCGRPGAQEGETKATRCAFAVPRPHIVGLLFEVDETLVGNVARGYWFLIRSRLTTRGNICSMAYCLVFLKSIFSVSYMCRKKS